MRDLEPCRKCGSVDAWLIQPARERGQGGFPVAIAVAYSKSDIPPPPSFPFYGAYELRVCGQCGHTLWRAQRFSPSDKTDGAPRSRACPDCNHGQAWHVPVARERAIDDTPRPLGNFQAFVCLGCGLTDWFLRRGFAEARKCDACPAEKRSKSEIIYDNGLPMAVALRERFGHAPDALGRLSVTHCTLCGHAEWLATELGGLTADPNFGVRKIERAPMSQAGPYR